MIKVSLKYPKSESLRQNTIINTDYKMVVLCLSSVKWGSEIIPNDLIMAGLDA